MKIDSLPGWPVGGPTSAAYCGDDARVSVLAAYGHEALDDDSELTRIARFAARLCDAPIAFVSIVECDTQRFIAREGADMRQTERSVSFCAHAMLGTETLVVRDATADPRFIDNPLVTGDQHVRFYAGAPLVSPEGVPLGALCVLDRTVRPDGLTALQQDGLEVLAQSVMMRLARQRSDLFADTASRQGEERLRMLADAMPVLAWAADSDGIIEFQNKAATDYFGPIEPGRGITDFVHPDHHAAVVSKRDEAIRLNAPFEADVPLRRVDGSYRWMLIRALPVSDMRTAKVRWFGTGTDIDDGHRRLEDREILASELSHRIKNIFAVVAGLVSLRARKHETSQALADELNDAIRALGRAHDFVRPVEGAHGVSLQALLRELMNPYDDGQGRVRLTGEDCSIGAKGATPLALIFHELATNAAKYGALSNQAGSVEIAIDCPEADEKARISWRERGGPHVAEAGAPGFGSRLVQMSIEGQLGGTIARRFTPDGLEIDMAIPLSAIRN